MAGNPRRKLIVGGASALGLAGLGTYLYRMAPSFLQQYAREIPRPIAPPSVVPDPRRWPDRGIHAAWLGHATILMKCDGYTILTDPIFSARCGISLGPITLGIKRLVAPALDIDQLPPIDLILVSHAHMDHTDVPSLRALESSRTTVITSKHNSDLLRVRRYKAVHELGWNEETRTGPAVIRGLEVNHWGARVRTDTWRGYGGYLITVGSRRILFAGDTAETDAFRSLPSGSTHLAIMPIGTYNPWIRFHCNPEQAWRMTNDARADVVIPIHHQTFALSREPVTEPIERFHTAAGSGADRIALRSIGQELHLS
jgi:L-ascorbate metabolism protein UlaG (beta-lactamase superfamily)